jgi:hypothetical protein
MGGKEACTERLTVIATAAAAADQQGVNGIRIRVLADDKIDLSVFDRPSVRPSVD